MVSHIMAFLAGIIVATIGLVPMAEMADSGVQKIQEVTRSTVK